MVAAAAFSVRYLVQAASWLCHSRRDVSLRRLAGMKCAGLRPRTTANHGIGLGWGLHFVGKGACRPANVVSRRVALAACVGTRSPLAAVVRSCNRRLSLRSRERGCRRDGLETQNAPPREVRRRGSLSNGVTESRCYAAACKGVVSVASASANSRHDLLGRRAQSLDVSNDVACCDVAASQVIQQSLDRVFRDVEFVGDRGKRASQVVQAERDATGLSDLAHVALGLPKTGAIAASEYADASGLPTASFEHSD